MRRGSQKCAAAGLFALLVLLFAPNVLAAEQVTMAGTVYPVGWDENDQVVQAVIVSGDKEYLIVRDAIGQELFDMSYRDVKVIGQLGEDSEGNPTVTVMEYEMLMQEPLRGRGE